jgi:hypothetical protein
MTDAEQSLTVPPARYWPDGDPVLPETEAALARIIETVHRVQARNQQ